MTRERKPDRLRPALIPKTVVVSPNPDPGDPDMGAQMETGAPIWLDGYLDAAAQREAYKVLWAMPWISEAVRTAIAAELGLEKEEWGRYCKEVVDKLITVMRVPKAVVREKRFSREARSHAVQRVFDYEAKHPDLPPWVAVEEVAVEIGCSTQTLSRWVSEEVIKELRKAVGLSKSILKQERLRRRQRGRSSLQIT